MAKKESRKSTLINMMLRKIYQAQNDEMAKFPTQPDLWQTIAVIRLRNGEKADEKVYRYDLFNRGSTVILTENRLDLDLPARISEKATVIFELYQFTKKSMVFVPPVKKVK